MPPSSEVDKPDFMTKLANMIVTNIKRKSNLFYYYYSFYQYLHIAYLSPSLSLWSTLINWYMLIFSTPDIRNPGPLRNTNTNASTTKLSVYYQNVQGLIPFTYLGNDHPLLHNGKIYEMHKCIYESEPDIIILNETWLKPSILNNEIMPNNLYKVFRCDRSNYTHPMDPSNPNKFRKNGGGILIAIKSSLLLTTNKVNFKCNAEFLAIELVLENGNKIIVATCYRVGTLGIDNCSEVTNAINTLLRKKRIKKFFLIGDFNLSNADWNNNCSSNNTEQAFIDEFIRAGLIQLINQPTHYRGNTLDILLTNSENTIDNIAIEPTSGICKSDHYTISFNIKLKIKRKKATKIKVFNFKRANWEHLNEDLDNVDWSSVIDSEDSNTSWINFKNTLTRFMNAHIPKITIKSKDKPPWFDAECYAKCREKERLHQKFKRTKSMHDELKFNVCRREYKSLMRKKDSR